MTLAIVYGSSMGNTEDAAKMIGDELGLDADIIDVAKADPEKLNSYDGLICGTSTWGCGDMQDDWDGFDFDGLNLANKTVAVFGLGDSQGYGHEFCDGMGLLYELLKKSGAKMIGECSTDGYNFDESHSINKEGKFVGLALDADNEDELSKERIKKWVSSIKESFI